MFFLMLRFDRDGDGVINFKDLKDMFFPEYFKVFKKSECERSNGVTGKSNNEKRLKSAITSSTSFRSPRASSTNPKILNFLKTSNTVFKGKTNISSVNSKNSTNNLSNGQSSSNIYSAKNVTSSNNEKLEDVNSKSNPKLAYKSSHSLNSQINNQFSNRHNNFGNNNEAGFDFNDNYDYNKLSNNYIPTGSSYDNKKLSPSRNKLNAQSLSSSSSKTNFYSSRGNEANDVGKPFMSPVSYSKKTRTVELDYVPRNIDNPKFENNNPEKLARFLCDLTKLDVECENVKESICLRKDVSLRKLFFWFDYSCKGYFDKTDFYDVMNRLGIEFKDSSCLNLIFDRFNTSKSQKMK